MKKKELDKEFEIMGMVMTALFLQNTIILFALKSYFSVISSILVLIYVIILESKKK